MAIFKFNAIDIANRNRVDRDIWKYLPYVKVIDNSNGPVTILSAIKTGLVNSELKITIR